MLVADLGMHYSVFINRIGRRFTANSYPIVRAREKAGLTQAQFASLLGLKLSVWRDSK